MITAYTTLMSIILSRTEGSWNRTIVAGAAPVQFLWAHLFEGTIIMVIQLSIYFCYIIFFVRTSVTWNSSVLIALLLLFNGFAGLTFGLLLSVMVGTVQEAFIFSQSILYPTLLVSGKSRIGISLTFSGCLIILVVESFRCAVAVRRDATIVAVDRLRISIRTSNYRSKEYIDKRFNHLRPISCFRFFRHVNLDCC